MNILQLAENEFINREYNNLDNINFNDKTQKLDR
jgi:hypothetical protein